MTHYLNAVLFEDRDIDVNVDDDGFEEFLFQSIQRYNTLQMFNLENVPIHLLQLTSDSICVAGKTATGRSELLKLKLPAKLTLPPEEEGRSKENDFKILSGIYIDNPIYQMESFGLDGLLLTSEININGLQVYSLTDISLGLESKIKKLGFTNWTNPNFMVRPKWPQVICSKRCHHPLIQVDVSINRKLKEIKHPFGTVNELPREESKKIDSCVMNNIKCNALSENLIVILCTHSGHVILHDLRTNDTFTSLPGGIEGQTSEIWTLSERNVVESSLDYFGILSNATSFCFYDIRKNGILFQRKSRSLPVENYRNMKLKFSEKEGKFSLSGMNSFVEIFRISENNFEPVFTHNGHCPNNKPSVFVTDHIWLQIGNKEYMVSICDNKTLNCWN